MANKTIPAIQTNEGNVGIGTTNPAYKLDLEGVSATSVVQNVRNPSLLWNQYALTRYQTDTKNSRYVDVGYFRGVSNEDTRGFVISGLNSNILTLLDISGGYNLGLGGVTAPLFNIDVASTQGKGIQLRYDTGTGYRAQITPYWNTTTDTRIDFAINRSANLAADVIMSVGYSTNVGIGTTQPSQKLDVRGNIKLGADGAGNYIYYVKDNEGTIINTSRSDASQQGLLRSDGWGNFTVDKSIGIGYSLGSSFPSSTIGNGNLYVANTLGINTTNPAAALDVRGGILRTNSRISNSEGYPLGHYAPGETVFEIDPSWSQAELQKYFNSTNVTWAAVADAPGGYCIYIDGGVNVGGFADSGFPYIPVDSTDIFYMECWIQNVGTAQGHYMGSQDFDHNFADLGGNPGSYGYWVMSNYNPTTTWTKVSGYIGGFSATVIGQFKIGTKYWTPQALFNYTAGTGTRACRISGWKVIKVTQVGNRYFLGNVGIGSTNPIASLEVDNSVASLPVLNLGGGEAGNAISDLYILNSYNNNTGVGYAAKVIGVNISGSLTNQNIPIQRTTWGGVTSATAIALGTDGPRAGVQDNAFQIWTSNDGIAGTALTQKFSITSAGDVGIGIVAPAQKLDVGGSIIVGINNIYGAYTRTPGGVVKPWFATASANTIFYNTNTSGSIFWQNSADTATLMSLTEQGRLGINTNDPSGRLHVLDTSLYAPSLTWNAAAATIIRSENGQIAFGSDDTTPYGIWQQVRTSSNTARPLLLNPLGGNVGIGLRNPTKKLHVVGSLYWDYNGTSTEEHSVGIQRVVAAANGAFTEIGTLAASSNSIRATFEIFHHDSGTIEYSLFELIANYYTGTTTDWVQLPSRTQAHYAGVANGVVVDARLQTTGGSIALRLRSIGGAAAAMTVNVRIKSNTNLTETSATGTGATVAGLLGFNGYEFPVTDNRFKATVDGLFIKNNGFIGVGTTNPSTLLSIGRAGSTTAASGLTFGEDAQANLYRAAEDTIKTDGSLNVAGLIYNGNSAYYSSVSKSTTANWGQYTVVLGNASYSANLIQVSINGGNLVWAGTFLASCHLSYRPNETWINVKLLECATYNCGNDDVTLLALSNSTTSQYGIPALVLKTNGAISAGYGTGYANNITVTVNGPSPNEFVLSSSSWTQPYTYQIATSANTKQIYTNENGNVGVGTTNPAVKLDIAGGLRVTGVGQIGPANGLGFALFNSQTNTLIGQLYGRAGGIQFTDGAGLNTVYIASGGNVGIGVTNASSLLNVSGPGTLGSVFQEKITNGTTTLALGTNATAAEVQSQGSVPLYLNYGGNDVCVVPVGNGNVGIGITNPGDKFQVNLNSGENILANIRSNGVSVNNKVSFRLSELGTPVAEFSLVRDGTSYQTKLQTVTTSPLSFGTNGTTKMVIDSAGYVGIGITNPTARLQVVQGNGGGVAAILLSSDESTIQGPSANTQIRMGSNLVLNAANVMPIGTNGAERIRITSAGLVGIGTNTPTTLLSVGGPGSTSAASGITFGGDASANLYRDSSASIRTDGAFYAAGRIRSADYIQFNSNLYSNAFTNPIDINVGNSAGNAWLSAIRFNQGGYVGMGTTQPSGKLHVVSSVSNETVLRADGTNGILFSVVDDLSDSLMSVNNSAGLPVLEVFADDRVVAGQYGSGDFVLINNKVGLGTSNPINKLSVIGGASIGSNTYNVAAPTNGLIVEGNLGIGTTNPASKLQVNGEIRIASSSSFFTHLNYLDGGSNVISSTNGGSTSFRGSSNNLTSMVIEGGGTVNTYYNTYLAVTNGNVGIGATAAAQKLDVRGFVVSDANSNAVAGGFFVGGSSHGMRRDAGSNDVRLHTNGGDLIFGAGGSGSQQVTLKNAGNFGINITTPTSKLHVVETTPTGSRIQLGSISTSSLMNAGLVNDFLILTAPFNAVPASTSNNNAKWGIKMGGGSTDAPDTLAKSACLYAVSEEDAGSGGRGYNRAVGLALHTSPFDLPNVERVRITALGNVGIGTSNPSYKLEVYSAAKTSEFVGLSISNFNNYDGTAASLVTSQLRFAILESPTDTYNASQRTFATCQAGNEANNSSSDGFFAISTRLAGAVAEKFRITSAGNVGVGTATAIGRLDVYDDTNAGHVSFVRNANTGSNAYSALVLRRDGNNNGLVFFTNSSARSTDGGLGNSTIRTDNGKLLLGAGATTYHSLETNGNVGIGLTNPSAARLHIKGDTTNPVIRVETNLIEGPAGGTAGRTLKGWLPIMTGANATDKVYIPLFGPLN